MERGESETGIVHPAGRNLSFVLEAGPENDPRTVLFLPVWIRINMATQAGSENLKPAPLIPVII
jgi:hypothetical protein